MKKKVEMNEKGGYTGRVYEDCQVEGLRFSQGLWGLWQWAREGSVSNTSVGIEV